MAYGDVLGVPVKYGRPSDAVRHAVRRILSEQPPHIAEARSCKCTCCGPDSNAGFLTFFRLPTKLPIQPHFRNPLIYEKPMP